MPAAEHTSSPAIGLLCFQVLVCALIALAHTFVWLFVAQNVSDKKLIENTVENTLFTRHPSVVWVTPRMFLTADTLAAVGRNPALPCSAARMCLAQSCSLTLPIVVNY